MSHKKFACSILLALGALVGCGNDNKTADPAGTYAGPLYLTAVRVWAGDDAFQYLKVGPELDLDFSVEDYKDAFEIGGYSGITIQDGYVLIGDQETPFIHKYKVSDKGVWTEVGQPLNLTDYYTESGDGFNDYFQAKKGNDQFFFYGSSRTARLHFKVDEWAYAGHYEDTKLPTRDGWLLGNMGNRTGVQGFKDAIVWPFNLEPDLEMGTAPAPVESYLAVYDGTTYAEKAVLHPSCPGLQQSTMDEDGNLYFSTTWESPLAGLYGKQPPNCVVKVKPDGTPDTTFGANGEQPIETLTGGLPGVNFRYIGGGKAVAALLNVSGIEGADFTKPEIPPEVFCQVENCEEWGDEYPMELWPKFNAKLYESYVIDLATKTAKKMTGYSAQNPGYGSYRIYYDIEGKTYFMEYSDGGRVIYELNPETAQVTLVGSSTKRTGSDDHDYATIARIR